MCGIVGFRGTRDAALLRQMATSISHRGPDDEGFLENEIISLGHRRLSIIDIRGGRQPITSEDGRLALVYNGEVYNYREIRSDLTAAGHVFRTDSDSEVILHSYEEWGCEAFERFNGMWALALADLQDGSVVLARDHFGIKPLYYARSRRRVLFASEIKALLQDPEFETRPNDQTIYEYLAHNLHDHKAETFFESVFRLPAAHYALVNDNGVALTAYWTARLREDGDCDPARFRRLFRESVRRRLVSEVPVGACLSGGLDSTTIVRLMSGLLEAKSRDSESMGGRLETFSAVFDNDPIDEREFIEEAVRGTQSACNFVRPTAHEFVTELETFVWHQDEPLVSTGPYAQWRVMKEAAGKVKVLLDGQGGDELLAGYVPYHLVYLRQLLRERRWGRLVLEALASRDVLWPLIRRRLKSRRRSRRIDERSLIRQDFRSQMQAPRDTRSQDNLKERLLQDFTIYSLPCLLRYEDRNSMAFSMESRVPYLDQEMVEYILALPPKAIICGGWSRSILREAMRGVIPENIRLRRWKVGFTTPEIRWLTNRRAVFTSLLASPLFQSRKYWNGQQVLETFRGACDGKLDNSMFFWRAINTEIWLRVFFDGQGRARRQPPRSCQEIGDRQWLATLAPDEQVDLAAVSANAGKHIFTLADGRPYARVPLRTRLVMNGDDIATVVIEALNGLQGGPTPTGAAPLRLLSGDTVIVSEKIVAIAQGRSFPLHEIRPSPLARLLSRWVTRSPHGIGVGLPETMELAIRTVGPARILAAAIAAGLGRLVGVKGLFYRVAGPLVVAIDGPTPGTIPPYNDHAKLAPSDPAGVATGLARRLSRLAGGTVGVAVVDANDLSVTVLAASRGVRTEIVAEAFRDNPLGQGAQKTPVAILRQVGRPAAGLRLTEAAGR
jgi:asparagine synthase (glutamine-hydrolysing)